MSEIPWQTWPGPKREFKCVWCKKAGIKTWAIHCVENEGVIRGWNGKVIQWSSNYRAFYCGFHEWLYKISQCSNLSKVRRHLMYEECNIDEFITRKDLETLQAFKRWLSRACSKGGIKFSWPSEKDEKTLMASVIFDRI